MKMKSLLPIDLIEHSDVDALKEHTQQRQWTVVSG